MDLKSFSSSSEISNLPLSRTISLQLKTKFNPLKAKVILGSQLSNCSGRQLSSEVILEMCIASCFVKTFKQKLHFGNPFLYFFLCIYTTEHPPSSGQIFYFHSRMFVGRRGKKKYFRAWRKEGSLTVHALFVILINLTVDQDK